MTINTTQWSQVKDWLKSEVGESSYASWLAPLEIDIESSNAQDITVTVPTRFMHDWVLRHYSDLIKRGLSQAMDMPVNIKLDVKQVVVHAPEPKPTPAATPAQTMSQPAQPAPVTPQAPQPQPTPVAQPAPKKASEGTYQGNPLDPRFTFENFVTGKSNEFAYAAAKRIAESEDMAYNPFILHGGVGLGKTHLMHAIAWYIRKHQTERKVMYISAEKFLHNFISALKNKTTHNFKDTFRGVDVLMIDDVQFIAGKEATQEEFFHTF